MTTDMHMCTHIYMYMCKPHWANPYVYAPMFISKYIYMGHIGPSINTMAQWPKYNLYIECAHLDKNTRLALEYS